MSRVYIRKIRSDFNSTVLRQLRRRLESTEGKREKGTGLAQQPNTILQEFDWTASGVVQETRTQMVILSSQLITNVTIITQITEGNASLLLANLYNDINKGIAEAQVKATQIGASFQVNLSKSVEEVMRQTGAIYSHVESSLRNSTNYIEEAIVRLLNTTEQQLTRLVNTTRANLAASQTESVVETSVTESGTP